MSNVRPVKDARLVEALVSIFDQFDSLGIKPVELPQPILDRSNSRECPRCLGAGRHKGVGRLSSKWFVCQVCLSLGRVPNGSGH